MRPMLCAGGVIVILGQAIAPGDIIVYDSDEQTFYVERGKRQ